jgi:hypothetical protein
VALPEGDAAKEKVLLEVGPHLSSSATLASIEGTQLAAVGVRVRVHRGQSTEAAGTVVEDFGDTVGVPVDIGDTHIADPARRWAVALDDGGLMFLDSEHLTIE